MKKISRRQMNLASEEERSQSQIANKILREQSQNIHQQISHSFIYSNMLSIDKQSISLGMWNQRPQKTSLQQASANDLYQTSFTSQNTFRFKRGFTDHLYLLEDHEKSKSSFRKTRIRYKTSRQRCAISLISPKFDDEKLQPNPGKINLNKTNSFFLCNQIKQSVRDRKKMIIKKIKRDQVFDPQSLEQPRMFSSIAPKRYGITARNKPSQAKIQVKTNQNYKKYFKRFEKVMKDQNSLKISKLVPHNNEKLVKYKPHIIRRMNNQKQSGKIQSSEQFKRLKSLLTRQRLEIAQRQPRI